MLKIAAGIVGLLLVWLTFMSRKHPGIALGLVWCLYAMEQVLQAGFSFFVARGSLINISVFGVACFATLTVALRTKMFSGIRMPREALCALLLFLLVVCSVVWAPVPANSFRRLKDVAPYLLQFLILAPLCVLHRDQLEKAINVLVYFGLFVLIGLALCPIINRGIVIDAGSSRTQRLDANPLAVSSFAGYVILAAVFKIYGVKTKNKMRLLLHAAIVALGLFVLARSGSRGQVVAVVISLVIWLPVTARVAANRSSVLAFGTVFMVCGALYYFVSNGADVGRWQSHHLENHTVGRLDGAFRLLQFWYDAGPVYWLIGLGSSASWDTVGGYPHVVPLEVIGEHGILGFGIFTAFCMATAFGGWSVLRQDNLEVGDRVNLGLVLALCTFQFALSFKQGSLIGSPALFGYGITAGWFSVYLKKEARKNQYRGVQSMVMRDAYGRELLGTSEYRR